MGNLPDMRGRSPFGVGGSTAGRVTTGGSGINADLMGATGGHECLQAHAHGVFDPGHNHGFNDPGHNHGINDPGHNHWLQDGGHSHPNGGNHTSSGAWGEIAFGNSDSTHSTASAPANLTLHAAGTGIWNNASGTGLGLNASGTGASNNASGTGVGVENAGSGNAQNMPPMAVVLFAIYTGI